MEVSAALVLAMSTIRRLVTYALVASLSSQALCVSVAAAADGHARALIDSLPVLAEPELDDIDSGIFMDENGLALERSTQSAAWSAAVDYADPGSPAFEGNYRFALTPKHARGFRLALTRDRKEMVLNEALTFGSKTLLRFTLGNSTVKNREFLDDFDPQLVERTRSIELTRRVFLPETGIELGVGAFENHAAHGERGNGYRLRALGQLQHCRELDMEYIGGRDTQAFSASLDATWWRVSATAARAGGTARPTVSLSLALEIPLEGTTDRPASCADEFTLFPKHLDLLNEITELPAWRLEG